MGEVIVLGAGMAGVSAALQLQQRGWSVALVDRRPPGTETSFGNAGIIQAEAVEPYAMPRDLCRLLAMATGRSNEVHYHLRALPSFLVPLLRYWWHSAPSRHRRASRVYAELIGHATSEHQPLITAARAEELVRRDGFRVIYRSGKAMARAAADALRVRDSYGLSVDILEPSDIRIAEPALTHGGAGAIHWRDPWTVRDPGGLVSAYAGLLARSGAEFVTGDATALRPRPGGGWQMATDQGTLEAGAVVVALGPWSADFLKRFGYRIPMVRKRGYHLHYRTGATLDLPLLDDAFGYVMAPMIRGLRITTGAELAARQAPGTPVQLRRAEAAAADLLALGAPVENEPWMGTRPCMPDMLPVVGEAPRHKGLWFHFGHGHQGFTLGPATARLLAELMAGETPYLDARPFSGGRFA